MKAEAVITENELPEEVIEAIRQGQKIEAIKILRESTGLGLANAKVLVDGAARTHGPKKPIQSFADQPTPLGSFVKLLFALFIVAAGWYFYGS